MSQPDRISPELETRPGDSSAPRWRLATAGLAVIGMAGLACASDRTRTATRFHSAAQRSRSAPWVLSVPARFAPRRRCDSTATRRCRCGDVDAGVVGCGPCCKGQSCRCRCRAGRLSAAMRSPARVTNAIRAASGVPALRKASLTKRISSPAARAKRAASQVMKLPATITIPASKQPPAAAPIPWSRAS